MEPDGRTTKALRTETDKYASTHMQGTHAELYNNTRQRRRPSTRAMVYGVKCTARSKEFRRLVPGGGGQQVT
eukprot:1195934-Prorocentrum_minimum.AAC.8